MKWLIPVLLSMEVLLCIPAGAEMEKRAVLCDIGICLKWWPRLPAVAGWHQDSEESEFYAINAQAPDGQTFKDALTVIYAKASYEDTRNEIIREVHPGLDHGLSAMAIPAVHLCLWVKMGVGPDSRPPRMLGGDQGAGGL